MGKRVHVAKKYVIEYGDTEAFNWCGDKFYDLLNLLGGEPHYVGGDSDEPSDMFECPVKDYEDALKNLVVYISDPALLSESDDIRELLEELKVTADWLLQTMKSYYDEADKHDGWLHFTSI